MLSSYTPDVLPSRLLAHLLQFGRRALFNRFDFGLKKNLEIYGQNYPPEYPLTRITAKIALFYSFNDKFINEIDISLLKSKLKGNSFLINETNEYLFLCNYSSIALGLYNSRAEMVSYRLFFIKRRWILRKFKSNRYSTFE